MSEEIKKLEELLANDRKIIEDNYKEIERLKEERNKTYENGLNYFLELQEKKEEIERLKEENEELKHKLKLINSYVYGCDIDSLGSDKE